MSFVLVEYRVILSREDVAKLIIDNDKVEVRTLDGENIVIMGSGTVRKTTDFENGGFNHLFNTNVFFKDHDQNLWASMRTSTKDRIVYHGFISPADRF